MSRAKGTPEEVPEPSTSLLGTFLPGVEGKGTPEEVLQSRTEKMGTFQLALVTNHIYAQLHGYRYAHAYGDVLGGAPSEFCLTTRTRLVVHGSACQPRAEGPTPKHGECSRA